MQEQVREAFSKAAKTYDHYSQIQAICAERLSASLSPWADLVPKGSILELGAGSGLFTEKLIQIYPNRHLVITDFSEELLEINKEKHAEKHSNIEFRLIDATKVDQSYDQEFALIAHNFLVQWFDQPEQAMIKQTQCLKDGGLLLCCFPAENSFPEWQTQCFRHGIPFTANALPNPEKIGIALSFEPVVIDLHEDNETVNYPSVKDFFRHFKKIGANSRLKSKQNLRVSQFKRLIQDWPVNSKGGMHISYHTAFMAIKKDG